MGRQNHQTTRSRRRGTSLGSNKCEQKKGITDGKWRTFELQPQEIYCLSPSQASPLRFRSSMGWPFTQTLHESGTRSVKRWRRMLTRAKEAPAAAWWRRSRESESRVARKTYVIGSHRTIRPAASLHTVCAFPQPTSALELVPINNPSTPETETSVRDGRKHNAGMERNSRSVLPL